MSTCCAGQPWLVCARGTHRYRPDRRDTVLHRGVEDQHLVAGLRFDRLGQHRYRPVSRRGKVDPRGRQPGVPGHQEGVTLDHFEYPVQDRLLKATAEGTAVGYLTGERWVARIGDVRAVVRVRLRDQNWFSPRE